MHSHTVAHIHTHSKQHTKPHAPAPRAGVANARASKGAHEALHSGHAQSAERTLGRAEPLIDGRKAPAIVG
eukprot:6165664-Prymnesium_polylepis.2